MRETCTHQTERAEPDGFGLVAFSRIPNATMADGVASPSKGPSTTVNPHPQKLRPTYRGTPPPLPLRARPRS